MSDQNLTPAQFAEFFEALWGKTPFPWQSALAERVLSDQGDAWPEAITLPTASGKTACLDIALFALAAQARRLTNGKALTAPRRIFFVVDRRVIVDEAYDRAACMAMRLDIAQDGILKEVADRLRDLAGGPLEPPLACFQLRGGIYRDDSWARSPIQPTIVCSTVDQVGSRLLFRGYGRSFKAWSLQAGLVGNDSLILLDEAHCAAPFRETLNAVAKYRKWAQTPLPSPFHLVEMTATPQAGVQTFPDEATKAADRAHPVLGQRINAAKPCRLEVAEKAQGKNATKVNQALAEKLVAEARGLVDAAMASREDQPPGQGAPAIVIICNRVDTARRAYDLLERKHGPRAVLLTGRMRPLDKDDTIGGTLRLLSADKSEQRRLPEPIFVVATQTLEVGANLDFDLLVSECADLSALRQRCGRLNRMGRPVQARAVIVVRADQQQQDGKPDPVYGEALTAAWLWLNTQLDGQGELDMGIAGLEARLPEHMEPLTVTAPNAPVMLPAHLDALAQTAPEPCPSPNIALFLHGPQAGQADVQVCWRADLTDGFLSDGKRQQAWIDAVAVCPPTSRELMSVPVAAFRRWLAGESDAADSGDLESSETESETEPLRTPGAVLRWRGLEGSAVITYPGAIRPGDLLVVPTSLAGGETLGHIPAGVALDLGDRAYRSARPKAVLRLTAGTMADWPDPPRQTLLELAANAKKLMDEDPDGLVAELKAALLNLAAADQAPQWLWLRDIAADLTHPKERPLADRISLHPCGGLVVKGTRRLEATTDMGTGFSHEDDIAASGTVYIPLPEHLCGVERFAQRYTCTLPRPLAEDVHLAARCHDLGKADPRFQALLHGGNPWVMGPLLAKSSDIPQGKADYVKALKASGYPRHGRHELLSIRLLESAPELLAKAHDPDLVLHLIGSHHGHCRPFAPIVEDASVQHVDLEIDAVTFGWKGPTGLERLDSGVPERFWRLIRRYGWWGLAGLEAILMLSDHRRSEYEETTEEGARHD